MNHQKGSIPGLRESFAIAFFCVFALGIYTVTVAGEAPGPYLAIGQLFLIVPAALYLKFRNFDLVRVFRLRGVGLRLIGVSVLLGVAVTVLSSELDNLLRSLIPLPPEVESSLLKYLRADSFGDWVYLLLSVALFAGLFEEMLFRGLILQVLEERTGIPNALFLSAFAFAVFHLFYVFQVFVLGVLLAFVSWRTRSIIPSAIIHIINNAIAVTMVNLPSESATWYDWHGHIWPPLLILSLAIAYHCLKWLYSATAISDARS